MKQKPMNGRTVFVDMDGVLADFDGLCKKLGITNLEAKRYRGFYREIEPIDGAIAAVNIIHALGFQVMIATKPATGVPESYADKVRWVMDHMPDYRRRIIMTPDKGIIGGEEDFLIDDRIEVANCLNFPGTIIQFNSPELDRNLAGLHRYVVRLMNWNAVIDFFSDLVAP